MAEIRSYVKEKNKRIQRQADYKDKIRKHKLTAVYRVLLVLAAVIALVILIIVQYRRHVYTAYDIISSIAQESTAGTRDIRLGRLCADLQPGRSALHRFQGRGLMESDLWDSGCEDFRLREYGGHRRI